MFLLDWWYSALASLGTSITLVYSLYFHILREGDDTLTCGNPRAFAFLHRCPVLVEKGKKSRPLESPNVSPRPTVAHL
jgi:hypothetical protein